MVWLSFSNVRKDYKRTAIIQILLIFSVLMLGDIFNASSSMMGNKLTNGLLLILEAFYIIILIQLAKHLNPSRFLNNVLIILVATIFILSIIALNPFIEIVGNKVPWLIAVHSILCVIECYIIVLGLTDIYSANLHIAERLWGSVAMYLLIALGWGSFYELFVLTDPDSMGITLQAGYQTYSESLYYSLCSISGTGSVYITPSHMIRNFALVEAVWGVLFLVMLIGRLFSLPSATK
ncbi:MAG: hypothetical protein H7Y00_12560 [Fimbriimonadaceae bacterium]|nr:hypothetical protein [Chitinophagales bacterium]